jgi:hypothetical protein
MMRAKGAARRKLLIGVVVESLAKLPIFRYWMQVQRSTLFVLASLFPFNAV